MLVERVGLERGRGPRSKRRVTTLGIVPADELRSLSVRLSAGAEVVAMKALCFDSGEETFRGGVVPAVALSAHTAGKACGSQCSLVVRTAY